MTPRTAPLPAFAEPQLATLVDEPPQGDDWLHELKFDGYRILARREQGRVRLVSRRGNDWTAKFPTVRKAIERLPIEQAILDGEVAVVEPDGRTSFQALQNALSGQPAPGLVYFAFDLLFVDGDDLRERPLEARKAALSALLGRAASGLPIRYADHVVGHGPAFFREACNRGLEGIISKRRDAVYRQGRNKDWLKVKCSCRQEFVIGGFTEPGGSRAGLGALLVGYNDPEGKLVFAGKVGTGFSMKVLGELHERLTALAEDQCPFAERPPVSAVGRSVRWTRPELVAEVTFAEWTGDGRLRQPSFQGLREDVPPQAVVRERPDPGRPVAPRAPEPDPVPTPPPRPAAHSPRRGETAEVAGQRLSNPGRVLYPEAGLTKLDLAHFYERIADWMLPHVRGRPLTLYRCPAGLAGKCFYMKHSQLYTPPGVRKILIQEREKKGEYLVVDDLPGVISLVQMDILEIHTWNSTAEHLERPDRVVLDLDPGPRVPWPATVEAAHLLREALAGVKLQSFVKTTGGKGLHVVVPLSPGVDWDTGLAFSRGVAEVVARERPRQFTTAMPKAGREEKILIDYHRNHRTHTAVAAFSTRAHPQATVSVPVSWDELTPKLRSDHFTVKNVAGRLAALKDDPWKGYFDIRQGLGG